MALKSTRYRRVEPAALNRRAVARRKVEITGASLDRANKIPLQATIADISVYGCRLEVDAVLQEGETVQISFASYDSFEAQIVWQKANEAGCRFVAAISPKMMQALTPIN